MRSLEELQSMMSEPISVITNLHWCKLDGNNLFHPIHLKVCTEELFLGVFFIGRKLLIFSKFPFYPPGVRYNLISANFFPLSCFKHVFSNNGEMSWCTQS
jgi:hypothetical protein